MLEGLHDNIMYFRDDDDFASFCINPNSRVECVANPDGIVRYYNVYDFTKMYLDAIAQGIKFCIQDVNSHVNKDGFLGYRDDTKKIDNIERYYGED